MAVSLTETMIQGLPGFQIQNDYVGITILPDLGGKIASIRNLLTDREWLWTNPHLAYKRPVYGASYEKEYDTGGFDECFPTVVACRHPLPPWEGIPVPDHGELFSQAWKVDRNEVGSDGETILGLSTSGVRFPYRFCRTTVVPPDRSGFELHYTVKNLCSFPLPFIWCAHPLMRIEPGMRIEFPQQTRVTISFAVDHYPGRTGDGFTWPVMTLCDGRSVDLGTIPDPEKQSGPPVGVKLFTDALREGWTALRSASGNETFRFTFSLEQIRHVALWLNYGAWSGSGSPAYFNMAFEPAIGPFDALEIAGRHDHCVAYVPPNGEYDWQLGVEVD